ncbi:MULTISPECIES: hypothetical protein [unclassified Methanoculleus]
MRRRSISQTFIYHKRLIHAGKREVDGLTSYLYKDADLAMEEQKTRYHLAGRGDQP